MENKKNNKGVLILLVMFIILTFILGGYILYDKVLSKTNDKTNDKITDKNSSEIVEDKEYKDLYYTGEILDVDGVCGGFNLGFAWLSSIVVGDDIC